MDPLLIGIILIFGLGMIAGWYLSNMINGSRYESLLKNTAIIVEASLRNRANITLANYLDRVVPIRKQAATALANQYNLTLSKR